MIVTRESHPAAVSLQHAVNYLADALDWNGSLADVIADLDAQSILLRAEIEVLRVAQ